MGWKLRTLTRLTGLTGLTGAIRFDDSSSSSLSSAVSDSQSGSPMSPGWCPAECGTCDELGNCLTCQNGLVLQSFECVDACMDGFYDSNGECFECPIECSHCNSKTVIHLISSVLRKLQSFKCSLKPTLEYFVCSSGVKILFNSKITPTKLIF